MPDVGTVVTFIVLPLIAIASSVLGLKLAGKLGISPVQAQYVALLRGMNEAQQKRIGQLEDRVSTLEEEKAAAAEAHEAERKEWERERKKFRKEIGDLRQEIHEVRDLYAAARLADAE